MPKYGSFRTRPLVLALTGLLAACGTSQPERTGLNRAVSALGAGAVSAPVRASGVGASPFAACTADANQGGVNYADTEVEPWVDVNPTNPNVIVGSWQQDRWSDGGARGLVVGRSLDGGATWQAVPVPGIVKCTGGAYSRASDPWLSFAPDGALYHISLSFSAIGADNAVLVSKSTDSGASWSAPVTLRRDDRANAFNDKETITADSTDPRYVYAIWDRLLTPSERASEVAAEHALGFRGPVWFSRTTDAGATWETARIIYDPGEINQTIGNQVIVLPNADPGAAPTLLDGFALIYNRKNAHKLRGYHVAVIRSEDRGGRWSPPTIISTFTPPAVVDPDRLGGGSPFPVRTGNIIPEFAADPSAPGHAYAVWQDSDAAGRSVIKLSKSVDRGQTWSVPMQVNQTPGTLGLNSQAFNANVAVAADGTVAVTYYDLRRNADDPDAANTRTDYFLAHCHPGPANGGCAGAAGWSEQRLTPQSFNLQAAPVARGEFLGDYNGLKASGTSFLAFYAVADGTPAAPASSVQFTRFDPTVP